MKISFKIAILTAVATAFLVSCDEGSVGQSISQSSVSVTIDSTFTITGKSEASMQIPARTTQQLLGLVKADDYGVLESDFVTQFMPAMQLDTVGVTYSDIDSVKLIMRIPPNGFTGDSLAPMRATVYRLNKQLPTDINSSFDPMAEGYCTDADALGSIAYSATALGMGDSLYGLYERQVAVPLPRSWGQELFRQYKSDPSMFISPTSFAKWFPGVYVTNSYGSGRVMHITSSVVTFYYRKHTKTTEGNDTIVQLTNDYLATTPEIINNNNLRLTQAQSINERIQAGEVIIQAPVGLDARINFPTKEIIDTFVTARGKNLGIINNVYFKIPVEEIANDASITIPPYLLLVKTSDKETFFKENKVTDDITSYFATYDKTTKSYVFSEMRNYLISVLERIDGEEGGTVTDDDCDFTLVPVLVTSDTDYYNSTYVVNVTPWVDSPAMCKLLLDKVQLHVAFSVQQMLQKE